LAQLGHACGSNAVDAGHSTNTSITILANYQHQNLSAAFSNMRGIQKCRYDSSPVSGIVHLIGSSMTFKRSASPFQWTPLQIVALKITVTVMFFFNY